MEEKKRFFFLILQISSRKKESVQVQSLRIAAPMIGSGSHDAIAHVDSSHPAIKRDRTTAVKLFTSQMPLLGTCDLTQDNITCREETRWCWREKWISLQEYEEREVSPTFYLCTAKIAVLVKQSWINDSLFLTFGKRDKLSKKKKEAGEKKLVHQLGSTGTMC